VSTPRNDGVGDTLGARFESRLEDTGALKLESYCGYSQGFVYSVHNERFSSARAHFDLLLNVFKNFTSKDMAMIALILDPIIFPKYLRCVERRMTLE
jgi:hypothetical protein